MYYFDKQIGCLLGKTFELQIVNKPIFPGEHRNEGDGGGGGEREDAEDCMLGRAETIGGEDSGEGWVLVH